MFKNSIDESVFCKMLNTYISEFGAPNIILHLPRSVADSIDRQSLSQMNVKFWNKNIYRITVRDTTAIYVLVPQD